jgi:outer membrane protein assembly factor BamD
MFKQASSALVIICLLLVGCSKKSVTQYFNEFKPPQNRTENELFQVGERSLANGYYDIAINQFEMINTKYPYSKFSEQAQLNLIYAYIKAGQSTAAAATADRFIRYYPRSEHIDYAYYMKAVANFEQERSMMFNYLPVSISERDMTEIKKSFEQFATFLRLYPKSKYAGDARLRMTYVRNLLAEKEINAAKFYIRAKRYMAASNRLNYLLKTYPEAPQTEQALGMLIKANELLRLEAPARQAYSVLKLNFPHSRYVKRYQQWDKA